MHHDLLAPLDDEVRAARAGIFPKLDATPCTKPGRAVGPEQTRLAGHRSKRSRRWISLTVPVSWRAPKCGSPPVLIFGGSYSRLRTGLAL